MTLMCGVLDVWCTVGLFKFNYVSFVHSQLLDKCVFEQKVLDFLWKLKSKFSSFEDLDVSRRAAKIQNIGISSISGM